MALQEISDTGQAAQVSYLGDSALAMLTVNHGKGWRIPDPDFRFSWARASRQFGKFRDALSADPSVWTTSV